MSTQNKLAISQIGQIAITVHDLERAIAFYRDVLELTFLFQAPPGLAFFQCGQVRLMLGLPEKADLDHPASTLYYKVANIQAAYTALQARDVNFIDAPHLIARLPDHELWMVFFYDGEGNMLALMSEVPLS